METRTTVTGTILEAEELLYNAEYLSLRYYSAENEEYLVECNIDIIVRHDEKIKSRILRCKTMKSLIALDKKLTTEWKKRLACES